MLWKETGFLFSGGDRKKHFVHHNNITMPAFKKYTQRASLDKVNQGSRAHVHGLAPHKYWDG